MILSEFKYDIFDILIGTVYFAIVCLICKLIVDIVKDMVGSLVIKCVFDKIKISDSDEIVYGCKIGNGIVFNRETSRIKKFNGKHMDGMTDADVKAIVIETSPETTLFPTGFGGIFTNIHYIKIVNTRISKIKQDHLLDFPKLRYLYLNNNEIIEIPENLFIHNPELEVIDLSFNQINYVKKESFNGLKKLRFLDLRENIADFDHATSIEGVKKMIEAME
ncbi:hypothetical protein PVAND_015792 [Polypedilum vanderplanki]|uniref:Uncharacterized protein n=1 Tax=Polypedilum vanderplanki TaxID=319348 RepID=A0A9J6BDX7_POLVA|nr:hypothetical protein PVAND_015792 [Polypedilum vanderplanki]